MIAPYYRQTGMTPWHSGAPVTAPFCRGTQQASQRCHMCVHKRTVSSHTEMQWCRASTQNAKKAETNKIILLILAIICSTTEVSC